jgi:hypothetical protein
MGKTLLLCQRMIAPRAEAASVRFVADAGLAGVTLSIGDRYSDEVARRSPMGETCPIGPIGPQSGRRGSLARQP